MTDEFRDWYEALDEKDSDAVHKIIDLLAEKGVDLKFPHQSALKARSMVFGSFGSNLAASLCARPIGSTRSDRRLSSLPATRTATIAFTNGLCRRLIGFGKNTRTRYGNEGASLERHSEQGKVSRALGAHPS